jgi:hypothetical protein
MDITSLSQLLDHWSFVIAHSGGPLTPLETNNLRDVLRRSRVEIERLGAECAAQRALKNQARADLVKCADKLNAYTDRMITAGLMS